MGTSCACVSHNSPDSPRIRSRRSEERRVGKSVDLGVHRIRDHCVTGVQTCALPISLAAEKGLKVSQDRLQAGVDSEVEVTKSKLGLARVKLGLAQAEGNGDVLRLRLSQLTGLPADSIQ